MSGTFPLFDTVAARSLDVRATTFLGDDPYLLMQRAGHAAWQHLLLHWPQAQRVLVVCGPGNNGGDGYVLARHAQCSGRQVQVIHLRAHMPRSESAQRACTEYIAARGQVEWFTDQLPAADVVVDALFGLGLARAADEEVAALIQAINVQNAPVFSLDVPSGVNADCGRALLPAVVASHTLQFICEHAGLRTGDALEYVGQLALDELDVPIAAFDGVAACASVLEAPVLSRWLLPRRRNTHKGESGRALCIGGDHGAAGAIILCAEAALRAGAGLLHVATRPAHVAALLARRPEAMGHALESAEDLTSLLGKVDAIALGPGLGQGEWAQGLWSLVLRAEKPLVLDADALNLLAMQPRPLVDAILTPHPGEAARLLGISTQQVQADRFAAARAMAERYAAVVVLKGAGTIIAAPGQLPRVIHAGNPGMAVGGMGDVLTGVILALRAQGLPAFDAASAGALLHSLAGDDAALQGERGLLPADLMPAIRRWANP